MTTFEKLRTLLVTPEQIELFNSIQRQYDRLSDEVETVRDELAALKDTEWNADNHVVNPMGTLEYNVTGSLKLVQFMDSVEQQFARL